MEKHHAETEKKEDPTKEREHTLAELESRGKNLAKQDADLTSEIDLTTKARNDVRKERRSIESRITTKRMNGETS